MPLLSNKSKKSRSGKKIEQVERKIEGFDKDIEKVERKLKTMTLST